MLAEIATRNNILDDAEFLTGESLIEFEPDHFDANIQYAGILLRRQRFHRAYDQAKRYLIVTRRPRGALSRFMPPPALAWVKMMRQLNSI